MNLLRIAFAWVGLGLAFLAELLKSTWVTMRAVLAGADGLRPAILAVPLELESDYGIAMLADMVTLTPGTTSLDVSNDRRTLFVHVLDAADPVRVVAEMKDGLEARIRRVLR